MERPSSFDHFPLPDQWPSPTSPYRLMLGTPLPIDPDPVPPTPEEIQRRCEEVQATWTERERLKRLASFLSPWEPPRVILSTEGD